MSVVHRTLARRLVACLLSLSCLFCQSCSLFVPWSQSIAITASDPDAEILVDGLPVGQGMARVDLRRNRHHSVMARNGDRVGTRSIGHSISTTGVLDIVGGFLFLVPFIGLVGPGFWTLESESVSVVLPAEERPSS